MPRISEPTRLILSHNKHRIILVRFLVSNNLLLSLKGMPSQVNFRVFAIYQICWVGKHINIILEPTNSPPQDQTNPRKARLKVAFRTLFPTAIFFFVGWDWFYVGNGLQETRTNQILRKHPFFFARSFDTDETPQPLQPLQPFTDRSDRSWSRSSTASISQPADMRRRATSM